ncbi:hypothetical protein AXG93_1658s1010 [Marchantia polymorpha subsp. ruderalis]|uniref:Uncharacterized protein n=1 Tax=Marchantia polymorpha subsp. ruderalis TaxID=1480154 RepID=A0A176WM10_MARPO|nr:hypothetical protein AXG93_1658s1010 [Marchantia polymorpha subsp. ruderalis]
MQCSAYDTTGRIVSERAQSRDPKIMRDPDALLLRLPFARLLLCVWTLKRGLGIPHMTFSCPRLRRPCLRHEAYAVVLRKAGWAAGTGAGRFVRSRSIRPTTATATDGGRAKTPDAHRSVVVTWRRGLPVSMRDETKGWNGQRRQRVGFTGLDVHGYLFTR